MQKIAESLEGWYLQNKRNLPWRNTNSSYFIWLSEIILQQTRVLQGLNYYNRFIERFPRLEDLANAPIEDVLKLWQGLGYYSRARNLHETAKIIIQDYKGKFPATYQQLLKLKGIGKYTAAAVASIAFNEPVALVDGNVSRVLSRYYGIDIPVDSKPGKDKIKSLADEILNRLKPGMHNQALMELGALVCLPKKPACNSCPLNMNCIALAKNLVSILPVKKGKIATRARYFNYLIISVNNGIFIRNRTENDIWKGLYDFPMIETTGNSDDTGLSILFEWKKLFAGCEVIITKVSSVFKHLLTHQTIYARFYHVEVTKGKIMPAENIILTSRDQLDQFPVPKLIERYLENEGMLEKQGKRVPRL